MDLRDFILTPIFLIALTFLAFYVRPYVSNSKTKPYFIPGLLIKFFGGIVLGLVYQYFYGTGDTFSFHTHGSRWIWNAFMDNPIDGFRLIFFSTREEVIDLTSYTQHIWYFRDLGSFNVCRFAGFFDIFTFSTYSSTSLFFSIWSFSGWWMLFTILVERYNWVKTRNIAIAIFFIPSVVIWGSGILKDTLTIGALGWMIWSSLVIIEKGQIRFVPILMFLIGGFVLYSIKIYILISFIPFVALWLYIKNIRRIKHTITRVILSPIVGVIMSLATFSAIDSASKSNDRYSIENIAQTAKITAYDLRYGWGARDGENSGYTLGDLDGTWQSLINLLPSAVNVALFRPYLWEVRNPLMILAALESLVFLFFTLKLILQRKFFRFLAKDAFLLCAIIFVLTFSFAVGVSTFNFGTLVRYKIPALPLFGLLLAIGNSTDLKKKR